jgi:cytochrome c-type biogenesis protein CcmE
VKLDTRIITGILVIFFVLALGYSTVSNYLVKYNTVTGIMQDNPKEMVWVNGTMMKESFFPLDTGEYTFVITDGLSMMNVSFKGVLPSSFGTESDIVLLGTYSDRKFYATKMITKCPTKYQG